MPLFLNNKEIVGGAQYLHQQIYSKPFKEIQTDAPLNGVSAIYLLKDKEVLTSDDLEGKVAPGSGIPTDKNLVSAISKVCYRPQNGLMQALRSAAKVPMALDFLNFLDSSDANLTLRDIERIQLAQLFLESALTENPLADDSNTLSKQSYYRKAAHLYIQYCKENKIYSEIASLYRDALAIELIPYHRNHPPIDMAQKWQIANMTYPECAKLFFKDSIEFPDKNELNTISQCLMFSRENTTQKDFNFNMFYDVVLQRLRTEKNISTLPFEPYFQYLKFASLLMVQTGEASSSTVEDNSFKINTIIDECQGDEKDLQNLTAHSFEKRHYFYLLSLKAQLSYYRYQLRYITGVVNETTIRDKISTLKELINTANQLDNKQKTIFLSEDENLFFAKIGILQNFQKKISRQANNFDIKFFNFCNYIEDEETNNVTTSRRNYDVEVILACIALESIEKQRPQFKQATLQISLEHPIPIMDEKIQPPKIDLSDCHITPFNPAVQKYQEKEKKNDII